MLGASGLYIIGCIGMWYFYKLCSILTNPKESFLPSRNTCFTSPVFVLILIYKTCGNQANKKVAFLSNGRQLEVDSWHHYKAVVWLKLLGKLPYKRKET